MFQVNPQKCQGLQQLEPIPICEEPRPTGVECEILLTTAELRRCRSVNPKQQIALIASAAKRQKIEVRLKELTPSERLEFEQAKDKELNHVDID